MILTLGQVEAVLQAVVDGNDRQDASAILAHILHEDARAAAEAADAVGVARVAATPGEPARRVSTGEATRRRRALTAAIEYQAADRRARKIERRAAALSATAAHERQTAALMRGKP